MSNVDYRAILEHSYQRECDRAECAPASRLDYLGQMIFDFVTYDSDISAALAWQAVEVCNVITERQTYDYIKDVEKYRWFVLMCNMPFFAKAIDWGTSIRGAFWTAENISYVSLGLWVGDQQMYEAIEYTPDNWRAFIRAVVEFAKPEMNGGVA